ncbi:MAG: 4-hydroxythreonine-4-phosphate dehydrogenase PdxA [Deltaproteobacteria bacterium]|nr:4-hydroxythreonine-4-phosphate dehydrogenase PdxA [Deltaproteobacteria bacterium]
MSMRVKVAITMGDPVGVGPEVVLKALADARVKSTAEAVVIGDEAVLRRIAALLKLPEPTSGVVRSISSLDALSLRPGCPGRSTGKAMLGYIEKAVDMALAKEVQAVVTAPISKEAANKAGFKFSGHTELIAHLTGAKDYRMMLGGKNLKVVLVTIHEPIKKVPGLITKDAVFKTIRITDDFFKGRYGLACPRIAVCGLNPHAGEAGMFGSEEKRFIEPAVKKAKRQGIDVTGPLPADTVFYRAVKKREFDCVVCMYHDQGLGPLKLLHFEDGINVTLGLPIIRTSVDHGTAYDIAWQGTASHESMVSAILEACRMARKGSYKGDG